MLGALTVGIVTKPFLFEGRKRMRQAEMGIAEMRKHVDTMIVVPNERLLAVVGKGIPFQDALKKADEVLLHATQGISSIICVTGLVNVDFADVRTVMQNGGSALMGTGIGRGENRAMEAAQQAISSPLLDNISIAGATGVLINITGGDDLTLGEVTQISEIDPRRRRRRGRDHLRRRARSGDARRDPGHRHRHRLRSHERGCRNARERHGTGCGAPRSGRASVREAPGAAHPCRPAGVRQAGRSPTAPDGSRTAGGQ